MTPDAIENLFTGPDGAFLCARWGRPIAPIVFGVDDDSLRVIKGACEAVVALAGHQMAETDPELGSNLMFFFLRDWSELLEVPDLDALVPDLAALVGRLQGADAGQYRFFRFEQSGAIRAGFVFLRMQGALANLPAADLALDQMVRVIALWAEGAFADQAPLARDASGALVLRDDIAGLIRALYDPVLPAVATDPSHALRLAARIDAPARE